MLLVDFEKSSDGVSRSGTLGGMPGSAGMLPGSKRSLMHRSREGGGATVYSLGNRSVGMVMPTSEP